MKKITRVMLIDDSKTDNFYHEYILRKADVAQEIVAIESADAALEYLVNPNSPEIDLIYLDVNMPRMTGFEFVEAYQKIKSPARHITIVMLPPTPSQRDIQRSQALTEIRQHVTKPLTVEAVREITNKYF